MANKFRFVVIAPKTRSRCAVQWSHAQAPKLPEISLAGIDFGAFFPHF